MTVGGKTIGSATTGSTMILSGLLDLASHHANGVPNKIRHTVVATASRSVIVSETSSNSLN